MSRLRILFFGAASACAVTGALFACVGDDPATTAPTPDGGGTPPPPPLPPNPPPNPPPPSGDAGSDAGQTFCQTRSTPPGATDYFCADFDEDPDASAGWTKRTDDGGGGAVMQLITSVASSLPSSLVVTPGTGDPALSGVQLEKDFVGAKNVTEVLLRTDVNPSPLDLGPPNTGTVDLLEVSASDTVIRLNYARGPATLGPPASKTNYTGYFVTGILSGSVITFYDAPALLSALPPNQWRTVEMDYVTSTGNLTINVNSVTLFTHVIGTSANPAGSGSIGALPNGQIMGADSWRYDNVELAIFRAP